MTAHRLKCSHPFSAVHFVRTWWGVIDSSVFGWAAARRAVRDSTLVAWYRCLYAPRTGGAYDSHHRTAGIAGRTRRRGGVAAGGARAAGGTCTAHRDR